MKSFRRSCQDRGRRVPTTCRVKRRRPLGLGVALWSWRPQTLGGRVGEWPALPHRGTADPGPTRRGSEMAGHSG